MLFRLEDVYKFYGAHEVLRGATLQVNPGERVGLVGRNGAGKTTIFRLLTRREEADQGEVILVRGLRVGLLEQEPVFTGERSIRDEALAVFTALREIEDELARLEHRMAEVHGPELDDIMHAYSDLQHRYEMEGGFTYHSRAESVLIGLGFRAAEIAQPANQLSGGQKARLALARLLLSEPDVLLLDEPTNHLDVDAVEWLEDFLADYKRAFVIISHDRFLLDHTVTKIIEIDGGRANVYSGNYTAYVKQREERRLVQQREYEQQQELIARTEEFVRRNLAGQKTKQAKSRRNMLERMERVEAVKDTRTASFGIKEVVRASDNVLAVSDLAVGYGKTILAGGMHFLVRRGERLGIIGPNGTGKTTFLKTVIGDLEPLEGGFTWGANVHIEYFDQQLESLDYSATVVEEMAAAAPRATPNELRGYLARFLFTGDDIFKPVAGLSGGEKSRIALAKLVYSKANVLVLDEPTNHLDIPSREALEQALAEYPGTILTVSHDRYFLDKLATEILHFEDGLTDYHTGSYSDFYAIHHQAAKNKAAEIEETAKPRPTKSAAKATPKGRPNPQLKGGRRKVGEIESEIADVERQLTQLNEQLSAASADWGPEKYAEIGERQRALQGQLESLYRQWETGSGQ